MHRQVQSYRLDRVCCFAWSGGAERLQKIALGGQMLHLQQKWAVLASKTLDSHLGAAILWTEPCTPDECTCL